MSILFAPPRMSPCGPKLTSLRRTRMSAFGGRDVQKINGLAGRLVTVAIEISDGRKSVCS